MRALMKGMTDAAFERQFGTEEQCFAALLAARKAAGMACPACGNTRIYVSGRRIGCSLCNRRWSLTAGTVMASTKLPLATWFRAMHAMTSTKQSISAVELGRRLGVSYPTAWYLEKRLHHAMTEREACYVLGGPGDDGGAAPMVEADDVYLGGERNKGSGPAGKTSVIAAAERLGNGRMGNIGMKVVGSFSSSAVKAFAEQCLAATAHVHTDGLRAFNALGDAGRSHRVTPTGGKRPARARGAPFFVVNTAIANLSTAIKATHKTISAKHADDYLGSFCWTTNRRREMTGMVQALCRAISTSTRLTRRSVYDAEFVPIG
jgi:transposase-like protein